MFPRKDQSPEPLYRPRGRKCSRVRLPDWLPMFDRASVGIPFYVHRDEIPTPAVRNLVFRIGAKLGKRYSVNVDKDTDKPFVIVRQE